MAACSSQAARRGVRVGMPLAEARTLVPSGHFAVNDPAADRDALRQLAWTCQRFTPRAGLEEAASPESLFLDVTGCVAHFGDIHQLCQQVAESFHSQGYRVRIAVAPTFGAAWAVAHTTRQKDAVVLSEDCLEKALAPLPLWGLRLPKEMLLLLAECGLQTIGQVLNLSRSSLPSRFGPELLKRLDQAFGKADELLEPELPPRPIRADARFEFPLWGGEAVQHVLQRLLHDLIAQLNQRRCETQRVIVTWQTEDGERGEADVRLLRPTASAGRLWELLSLHLEQQRFESGITFLQAEAIPCRSETVRQAALFEDEDPREGEFVHLIERLSSRLGSQSVVRARLLPEAQPEQAVIAEPWLTDGRDATDREREEKARRSRLHRPLRMLASPRPLPAITDEVTGLPQRFHWSRREHVVARCEGPERIETGWWRARMVRRDYYRVETTAGSRFWLFRDLTHAEWYLQGVFE